MKNNTQKDKKISIFIDSQNLNQAIVSEGWKIDYNRFFVYLKEFYNAQSVTLFIGYQSQNASLYAFLQKVGYQIIFKPVVQIRDGKIKGNCDGELILDAVKNIEKYDLAILVSGDGDFHCLVAYWKEQGKFLKILAPTPRNYSSLLRKLARDKVSFVSDLRKKIEYTKKQKANRADETAKSGPSS